MIINSNDIFTQIGLVVQQKKKNNYNTKPKYVICLQIQLNEDQKYILEVKDFDDPHNKAVQFCHKHRLNKLAIQIVQAKIREAMEYQEQKIMKNKMRKYNNNSTKQKNNDKVEQNNSKYQSKSPHTNKKVASPQKSKTKQFQNSQSKSKQKQKSKSKSKSKTKLSKTNSTDNIYLRSLIKSRMIQQRRNKLKVQMQKKQQQQLTFKPVINNVSQKIVQFLKTNNIPKPKKQQPPKKMYDEMKQCTFKPKINKVSQIIANNKSIIKQQRQNHKNLYDEQHSTSQIYNKKKNIDEQYSFKPQINPKSSQKITMPFFKRLQVAAQKKSQATTRQKFYDQQQCSFKPKINRGPLKDRSKQNLNIWEYLHNNSKKQSHLCSVDNFNQTKQSSVSNQYYENLIQERINSVFAILDSDNDGLISPNQIAIQQLQTQSLHFLKPIFLQMDQINATLNRYQFKKAVQCLIKDSDPGSKGAFISSKWKKQIHEKQTFQPNINKRSKQLASNRSVQNLYKQGLKQKQNKQYRLQKQRALRQEKQLMQCSFKPVLNHSSKVYIEKVIKKKADYQENSKNNNDNNNKNNNNQSISDLRHSFGRSGDDGLF